MPLGVRVKLMGMLRSHMPAEGRLELPESATVEDALAAMGIPGAHVHLVMVNGQHERDRHRRLAPGDELLVLPPVAGG